MENKLILMKHEKSDKEFVMRLTFDPRVGLKRFFTLLKNLFNPTRRSSTSHKTNYLSFFSLLNQTLNFQNCHLFCALQFKYYFKKMLCWVNILRQ